MGLSYYGFADDASAIADLLRGRGGPTHPALREACRAAGLRVSGTVAELEARLEESVGLGGGEGEEEEKGWDGVECGAGGDGGDGDDDYDRDTDDEDGRAAAAADDDARASGWGVGTNITICKPEAAFGRGVIVGHHPGAHELWRVELVPSQSKSGSVSVCAGAPRVLARSYFLTSREVERGLLQLGAT